MGKTIVIFVMAFFALAINLPAQKMLEIKQSVSGNMSIDEPAKTVGKVDAELVRLYGKANVLKAWESGVCAVVTSKTKEYANWGLLQREVTSKIFLAKKGDVVTTAGGEMEAGARTIAWLNLMLGILTIILGIYFVRILARSNLIAIHNPSKTTCFFMLLTIYVVAYVSYKLLESGVDEYLIAGGLVVILGLVDNLLKSPRIKVLALGIPMGIYFWIGDVANEWEPFIINGILLLVSIAIGYIRDIRKVRDGYFYNPSLGH